MAFDLSEKITVDQSENYIMSIRLSSDGLSFSVYNPSVKDSFWYKKIVFEQSESYISSLKDCFFEYDFLSWHYKKIYVICVSAPYTIVPQEFFQEKSKKELLTFTTTVSEIHCLSNTLKKERSELLFGVKDDVYEFCCRSLVNPIFVHHLTPVLPLLGKLSSNRLPKQLFVNLHHRSIDVVSYTQGTLSFINTFEYKQIEDIIYYILYVWKQMEMNQQRDQLNLFGDTSLCHNLNKILRNYIQCIETLDVPTEAFLRGIGIVQTPLDIIALSLCEL